MRRGTHRGSSWHVKHRRKLSKERALLELGEYYLVIIQQLAGIAHTPLDDEKHVANLPFLDDVSSRREIPRLELSDEHKLLFLGEDVFGEELDPRKELSLLLLDSPYRTWWEAYQCHVRQCNQGVGCNSTFAGQTLSPEVLSRCHMLWAVHIQFGSLGRADLRIEGSALTKFTIIDRHLTRLQLIDILRAPILVRYDIPLLENNLPITLHELIQEATVFGELARLQYVDISQHRVLWEDHAPLGELNLLRLLENCLEVLIRQSLDGWNLPYQVGPDGSV
mmetsp:Transcript_11486/g.27550  ORF Transcript_11486/g.27550 Transcript_11486/m.27550 type:complete len:279 (-) Transcript_11486:1424-2260(-)